MSHKTANIDDWDIAQRQDFLTTVDLFRDLPSSTLSAVAASGRVRRVGEGDFVFLQGERASAVNILVNGQVKVIHESDEGHEVILRMIHPGEIFGGAAGWGEPRYPLTAVTLEEAVVLSIPAASFRRLIEDHPDVALAMIRELAARLREAEARIQDLQTERVERRIARALLRLANKAGQQTETGIEIALPLSRQDLAELCGTTTSTVSRTLRAWDRRGIIRASRERVRIIETNQLLEIAEDCRLPEER